MLIQKEMKLVSQDDIRAHIARWVTLTNHGIYEKWVMGCQPEMAGFTVHPSKSTKTVFKIVMKNYDG